jgi:hypothetical protein
MVKAVKGTSCAIIFCPVADGRRHSRQVRRIYQSHNNNNNDFIIEDLDDEHLLVKDVKVGALKARLKEVRFTRVPPSCHGLTLADAERQTQGSWRGDERRRKVAAAESYRFTLYLLHSPEPPRILRHPSPSTGPLRHSLLLRSVLDLGYP